MKREQMIKVIMIEDDPMMAELVCEYLKKHSIEVKNYESPYLGLSALDIEDFDLLILDLSLPEMDGLEVCRQVRAKSDIPIIISSARSDMDDKSTCFYLGADDFLPKPYDSKELLLRIHSILRRIRNRTKDEEHKQEIFTCSDKKKEIRKNGVLLDLTNAEYEILSYLIKRTGFPIKRREILDNVDSMKDDGNTKSMDVMISRLRSKIEENHKKPRFILTVRGLGYKFINE